MPDFEKGSYVVDWEALDASRPQYLKDFDARADAARQEMLRLIRETEAKMFSEFGAIPHEWVFTCDGDTITARPKGWRVFDVARQP